MWQGSLVLRSLLGFSWRWSSDPDVRLTSLMRILHVEGGRNFYGGAHQVLLLIEGLKARGIENVLVCPKGSELSLRAQAVCEVVPLAMGGDLDVRLIPRLRRVIQRTCPDLLHLQSRIGADVMGGIAGRLEKCPVIHTRRQDNPESRLAVALKYRLHDRVIAISRAIGQVLLSEGLPPEKLRCIADAVEITPRPKVSQAARRSFRRQFGIKAEAPVIGVVAQLIARKGHGVLIEALPAILERHPEVRVIFFGQGPLAPSIENQLRASGLEEVVTLAGFRDDLQEILPCLDLIVHPALREGMGVSLLQSALAELPIVASAVGGIPEVVKSGETGLLVTPSNPPELAHAVAALLDDPSRLSALGQAGRRWVELNFSAERLVEETLAVYHELFKAP